MLPPGHIAVGYLAATAYESIFHPAISISQSKNLLWIGASSGFIPDIDMFFAFLKVGAWRIDEKKADHRSYLTHRPILWLLLVLIIFFVGKSIYSVYIQSIAIVIFLGTYSHFILDSLDSGTGIKWLWPFSDKLYTIKNNDIAVENKNFFSYWFGLVVLYAKKAKVTVSLEIIFIVTAIVFLFK
jgi:membrane-bound metal-dependent hydrolase YbcI (DUF457 family)